MKFVKNNQNDRRNGGINAGSMADIAFLLLIFFLVATTIDIDTGLKAKLPPWTDNPITEKTKDRNTLRVVINSRNELLVEGKLATIEELQEQTINFIINPNKLSSLAEKPNRAIVSLQNDRGTSYETYLRVYNELKAAYNTIWNEEARRRYGYDYKNLSQQEQKAIRNDFPLVISEAEPTDFASL